MDFSHGWLRLEPNTTKNSEADEFTKLPESVQAWLDADMGEGSRLSNNPSVVAGLAFRQYAKLSPAAARKELATLRESKAYQQGDHFATDKARLLSHIGARGQKKAGAVGPAANFNLTPAGKFPTSTIGQWNMSDAKAELAKLNAPDSPRWGDPDPTKKAAAIKRRAELMAKLGE